MSILSIVFICGAVEPGKDGVGDYTRNLSIELAKRGMAVAIMAISDSYINSHYKVESLAIPNYGSVPIIRLSNEMPWHSKLKYVKKFMNQNKIEWLSLQYVPYAYEKRGFAFRMNSFIQKIKGKSLLHIHFHELWAGGKVGDNIKLRITYYIQRYCIMQMLRKLKPDQVTSSIDIYQKLLQRLDPILTVKTLPLFSNIPVSHASSIHLKKLLPERIVNNRSSYCCGVLFGSYYYESWRLDSFILEFVRYCKSVNKLPLLLSIGNLGPGKAEWKKYQEKFSKNIELISLGFLAATDLSLLMQSYGDFGILTTPAILAGKSGAYMAYRLHGLPIFVKKNEMKYLGISDSEYSYPPNILIYEDGTKILSIPPKEKIAEMSNLIDEYYLPIWANK